MAYTKQVWENAPEDETPLSAGRFNHIEDGLEAAATVADGKYSKPGGGIPSTDLATAVQTSLGLADNSLQAGSVTKASLGLSNVENTADVSKPISTATQDALNLKQPVDSDLTAIAALTPTNDDILQRKSAAWVNRTPAQVKTDLALAKADVGLGSVDNTADSAKPVSTAQQTALNLKLNANDASVTNTRTPTDGTVTTAKIAAATLVVASEGIGSNNNDTTIPTSAAVKAYADSVGGGGGGGGGTVDSLVPGSKIDVDNTDPANPVISVEPLTADDFTDGTTNKAFLASERSKLSGIAAAATANDTDANLKNRANHTGTQSADTLVDGTTNKAFLATERTKLTGIATGATVNSADATLLARGNHTGTQSADTVVDGTTNKAFTATEKTKLAGVATGATANASDASLRARSSHTGTQSADTLTDGTTNKAFLATERTKLTGIETAADVTDSANVDAAGAVMNTDTSTAAMGFVVDEDTMTSNSATKVPTQQSVKAYVDNAVSGVSTGMAVVVVETGTEARPDETFVLWVDPRDDATRPDNMGEIDLWFTPNGVEAGDSEPPTVPTGLASSSVLPDGFTVEWDASTDDVAVTGYQVRLDGGTAVSEASLSHVFTGLDPETEYDVDVRARDAAGNWSDYCTPVAVTTLGDIPLPTARYEFNEGSGTTATSTAGGFTMTDGTGGSPVWGSGTIASIISGALDGEVATTVSEWTIAIDVVLTGAPGGERTLLWHRSSLYLNFLTDSKLKWYGASEATSASSVTSGSRRIVISQTSTTLKVYVDGVEFISSTQANVYNRANYTDLFTAPQMANVAVDTLRFWNGAALSADEVAALGA